MSLEGALGESLESSSHRNDDDGAIFVHLPTNNYKIKLANEPSKMQSRDRAPADETYNGSKRKVQRRAQHQPLKNATTRATTIRTQDAPTTDNTTTLAESSASTPKSKSKCDEL